MGQCINTRSTSDEALLIHNIVRSRTESNSPATKGPIEHSDSEVSDDFDADSWLSSARTLSHQDDPSSEHGSPQCSSRTAKSKSPGISPVHRSASARLPPPIIATIHPTMHHANTAPVTHAPPGGSSHHNLALSTSPPSRPASPSSRPLDIVLLPPPHRWRSASLQSRSMHDTAIFNLSHDGAADPPPVRRRSQSPPAPLLSTTSSHGPTPPSPHPALRLCQSPAGRNLCRPPSASGQLHAGLDGAIHTAHGEWCPACRRPLPDCACGGAGGGFAPRLVASR